MLIYLHLTIFFLFTVGKPIHVMKTTEPDQEMIERYHKLYVEGLSDLFEDNKSKYGVSKDEKLTIM